MSAVSLSTQIRYEFRTSRDAVVAIFDSRELAMDWLSKQDTKRTSTFKLVKVSTYIQTEVVES